VFPALASGPEAGAPFGSRAVFPALVVRCFPRSRSTSVPKYLLEGVGRVTLNANI
jgi:hypothetical protein